MKLLKDRKRILYLIPIFALMMMILYIYKYNVVILDSDASSELVLANLLNKTGSIVSKDWYYSTEIRIINTNLIFAPLFSIFHNWTIIRAIGAGICMLFMMLSALFFYKELGIKNKAILVSLLILPLSIQYFGMYIAHPYYEFAGIKTFLTLGLLLKYLKDDNKLCLILIGIVGFIQGLDGLRNIILTILPLIMLYLIIEGFNKYNKLNSDLKDICVKLRKPILILLISGIVGFLVNILVISKIYSFQSFNNMKFRYIEDEALLSTLNSWIKTFGYTEGNVMSTALIHNGFAIAFTLLTIIVVIDNIINIKKINKGTLMLTGIYAISVLILLFISLFVFFINSDMERYNLPVALLALPLVFDWFENRFNVNKLSKEYLFGFVILFIICGIDNYNIFRNNDNREVLKNINTGRTNYDTVELNNIVYMLEEQDYKNGYSYFWNGNIMTELSNGNIEVWVWGNGGLNTTELKNIDEMYKWLQVKAHDNIKPSGKVFLLFTPEELIYSQITKKLEWSNVVYNSENFTIYGYNSYDELFNDFNN